MMNLTYMRFIWKNHWGLALFSAVLAAILQFLIIWIISTIDTEPFLNGFLRQLPPQVQILFNEEFMLSFSAKGGASFGFNHPVVLTLLGILAITVPARHISGEAESGTLELLMAHPLRREALLLSLWSSAAFLLLAVVLGALIGSVNALIIFKQFEVEIFRGLLVIATNLWLLFIVVMTFTLLLSAGERDSGRTSSRSAAVIISLYFWQFISTIWESVSFTKAVNLFHYYQPQKLMFGQRSFGLNAAVLLLLLSGLLVGALCRFARRDIPG